MSTRNSKKKKVPPPIIVPPEEDEPVEQVRRNSNMFLDVYLEPLIENWAMNLPEPPVLTYREFCTPTKTQKSRNVVTNSSTA